MVKLSEQQNRSALAAAAARGACILGQPDPESAAIIAEERARAVAGDEPQPMRSVGELAQEEAAAEHDLGTPTAGGGA
jgi:hypothetical protein